MKYNSERQFVYRQTKRIKALKMRRNLKAYRKNLAAAIF